MHDKAALLSIMRKTSPKTLSRMMTVSKNFHEVGTVAMRSHLSNINRFKVRVREFAKRARNDSKFTKTTTGRFRKLALASKAQELGVTNHLRPNPRSGLMGTKAVIPAHMMNKTFVKNLGHVIPGRFPFKR